MKRLSCATFLLYSLLLISTFDVYAQTYTLSGMVKDAQTGEPLPGAALWLPSLKKGVTSNSDGKYSISLPQGNYQIECSFIGYKKQNFQIRLSSSQKKDVLLESEAQSLSAVLISGVKQRQVDRNQMGNVQMSIESIRKMPTLLGEADLIKAVQLLPGIIMSSEGSSGFSVRGGSPDQNAIYLDEAIIYNPSHVLGFFSVFNNDAISSASVYKGDIPVNYGGRLSSVIDVESQEGNPYRWGFEGGIGILSARLKVDGPISKTTTFALSGRRSYFDLFLPLSSMEMVKTAKMYFYDMNLKLTQQIGKKDKLSLSGYLGRDVFGSKAFSADMNYGNKSLGLKWTRFFSSVFISNLSFSFSDYDYSMGTEEETHALSWKSRIRDYAAKWNFSYKVNEQHTLKFGLSSVFHEFYPGDMEIHLKDMPFLDTSSLTSTHLPKTKALENGIYFGNDQKIGKHILLKYGLRLSSFHNIGPAEVYNYDENYMISDTLQYNNGEFYHSYLCLEPRIGFAYVFDSSMSIKANYSRTAQYVQLAQNSTTGNPLDVWFSASPGVKPQIANQYSIGFFKNFKEDEWETSIELYYKDLKNVIDYKDHSNLLFKGSDLRGEMREGRGYSYGMELYVKKNRGIINGSVSYTLSKSRRIIPDINKGEVYAAPYDRPHAITILVNADITKKHSITANWVYYTGNPATFPSGQAVIEGIPIPVYTARNAYRMPNYHRLDIAYTYSAPAKPGKRFSWQLVVGCYNVYARKNAWSIHFNTREDGSTYSEMMYLFGIVPSLTFNFKF